MEEIIGLLSSKSFRKAQYLQFELQGEYHRDKFTLDRG